MYTHTSTLQRTLLTGVLTLAYKPTIWMGCRIWGNTHGLAKAQHETVSISRKVTFMGSGGLRRSEGRYLLASRGDAGSTPQLRAESHPSSLGHLRSLVPIASGACSSACATGNTQDIRGQTRCKHEAAKRPFHVKRQGCQRLQPLVSR